MEGRKYSIFIAKKTNTCQPPQIKAPPLRILTMGRKRTLCVQCTNEGEKHTPNRSPPPPVFDQRSEKKPRGLLLRGGRLRQHTSRQPTRISRQVAEKQIHKLTKKSKEAHLLGKQGGYRGVRDIVCLQAPTGQHWAGHKRMSV